MANQPLNSQDLQNFMDQRQVRGEIVHLETPTPTVETAAEAVRAHPDQIVKTVLFLVDGLPVLAIACGLGFIDRRGIAQVFGVGRKRVKLADAETVLEITGYLAGTVPPFGHRQPIRALLDRCIQAYPVLYAGGGEIHALVRLTPEELIRGSGGEWADLLSPSEET